ncbi:hypothetical protein BD311DRAFT_770893 [Dichomitus squalens]|uniref:Uncharacterized protein n=1 Tax=Dichomitus squalens TaxID=114155 RepID=A0A4Q9M7P3_9APHY|nr:hypothetical protein BD311DRAFT_770893 [Dichomitus squalens]
MSPISQCNPLQLMVWTFVTTAFAASKRRPICFRAFVLCNHAICGIPPSRRLTGVMPCTLAAHCFVLSAISRILTNPSS